MWLFGFSFETVDLLLGFLDVLWETLKYSSKTRTGDPYLLSLLVLLLFPFFPFLL